MMRAIPQVTLDRDRLPGFPLIVRESRVRSPARPPRGLLFIFPECLCPGAMRDVRA